MSSIMDVILLFFALIVPLAYLFYAVYAPVRWIWRKHPPRGKPLSAPPLDRFVARFAWWLVLVVSVVAAILFVTRIDRSLSSFHENDLSHCHSVFNSIPFASLPIWICYGAFDLFSVMLPGVLIMGLYLLGYPKCRPRWPGLIAAALASSLFFFISDPGPFTIDCMLLPLAGACLLLAVCDIVRYLLSRRKKVRSEPRASRAATPVSRARFLAAIITAIALLIVPPVLNIVQSSLPYGFIRRADIHIPSYAMLHAELSTDAKPLPVCVLPQLTEAERQAMQQRIETYLYQQIAERVIPAGAPSLLPAPEKECEVSVLVEAAGNWGAQFFVTPRVPDHLAPPWTSEEISAACTALLHPLLSEGTALVYCGVVPTSYHYPENGGDQPIITGYEAHFYLRSAEGAPIASNQIRFVIRAEGLRSIYFDAVEAVPVDTVPALSAAACFDRLRHYWVYLPNPLYRPLEITGATVSYDPSVTRKDGAMLPLHAFYGAAAPEEMPDGLQAPFATFIDAVDRG